MNLKPRAESFILRLSRILLAQAMFVYCLFAHGQTPEVPELTKQCKTCHGLDGLAKIPIAPNIAGEPAGYLVRQLQAFKSGDRQHEIMSVVSQTLEQTDIEVLADWYAAQAVRVTGDKQQTDDAAIKDCVECHGRDGLAKQIDTPHLAGESVVYIETQLKAFRSGKRFHEVMSDVAANLTDEQMRQAGRWYSQIELNLIEE